MPSVPMPVIFEIVTMYEVPEPATPMVPVAVPVWFYVMPGAVRLLVLKLASA